MRVGGREETMMLLCETVATLLRILYHGTEGVDILKCERGREGTMRLVYLVSVVLVFTHCFPQAAISMCSSWPQDR